MALTLITHPNGDDAQRIFAGFQPVKFLFKREDLAITDIESGTGGIKINITTDLTGYLNLGDNIYVYSEGADYIYDGIGTILEITATDITIDIPYVQSATGGYINYLKNYFVELQCVNKNFTDVNLLPFSLQSDGDSAGNISIDVSVMNDLNRQRGAIIQQGELKSTQQFYIAYRQVYQGSSETFTIEDTKLLILVYCTETPDSNVILNKFDYPKLYLGYPGAITIARKDGVEGQTIEMSYNELDINENQISNASLGSLDASLKGFVVWKWPENASLNDKTRFIEFITKISGAADFATPDFATPDFSIV